jgi:hypothetical protein
MKKIIYIIAALELVLVLTQVSVPKVVAGYYNPQPQIPPIAPSSWTGGSQVSIDLVTYPAPDWLELKSEGVKVTTPGQICHEFRGISYHWVPEIRYLKNGKWVKVESIGGWVPNTEGTYVVCANASVAGTYALFAYYNGPTEYFTATPEPIT